MRAKLHGSYTVAVVIDGVEQPLTASPTYFDGQLSSYELAVEPFVPANKDIKIIIYHGDDIAAEWNERCDRRYANLVIPAPKESDSYTFSSD